MSKKPRKKKQKRPNERRVSSVVRKVIEQPDDFISCPEFGFNGIAKSPRHEAILRGGFMEWDEGFRKREGRNRRLSLLNATSWGQFSNGQLKRPGYIIMGRASKVREFADGTARLMLSEPMTCSETDGWYVFDDHIWVDLGLCQIISGKTFEIRYGDLLTIFATIDGYHQDGDVSRNGLGIWRPMECVFSYFDLTAKKKRKLLGVYGDASLLAKYITSDENLSLWYANDEVQEAYKRICIEAINSVNLAQWTRKTRVAEDEVCSGQEV